MKDYKEQHQDLYDEAIDEGLTAEQAEAKAFQGFIDHYADACDRAKDERKDREES